MEKQEERVESGWRWQDAVFIRQIVFYKYSSVEYNDHFGCSTLHASLLNDLQLCKATSSLMNSIPSASINYDVTNVHMHMNKPIKYSSRAEFMEGRGGGCIIYRIPDRTYMRTERWDHDIGWALLALTHDVLSFLIVDNRIGSSSFWFGL
jgi:hypothetical protein